MATKKQPYRQPALEPFDFDEVMAELDRLKPQPEQAPSSGLRRALGDTGVSLVKGAIGVPEAMVGMADIITGGRAGKAAESLGFRPKEAKAALDELYSPEQQAANREVQQARGFVDTAAAALRNPSTIFHAAVESAPSLLPAGAVARGALALAPRMGGALAAGIGEGVVSAGQTAEQVRQETADGLLTAGQSALAAGSGGLTGIIGSVAGKVANRLGIGDVNQLVAGVRREGPEAQKAFARKLLEGFATEGVLQELPQSAQEQIAQNVALGKPWDEGVGNAAAMGALAGGAMGGAAAPFGHGASSRPALLPESGPMTRAANAGAEVAASQPLPAATDGTTLPAEGVAPAPAMAATEDGTPVFSTLVLDAKAALSQPGAMDAVRARFGDDGASQLLNSLNQAQNPNVKEAVRKKHLQAVEEAMFWLNAQRVPGEATQAAIGADAREALPAPDAQTQAIGMESQPTGTMRVGPDGVAVPETRVDAINTAQAQQEIAETAAAEQEAANSIEPQARRASAVYGEGLPKRPAPPLRMPERTPRADAVEIDPAAPNAVARYIAEQAATNTPAARAFVQDYRAGRITDADVLALITPKPAAEPTPDERLAAAAKAGQVESDSTAGLILNREGKPFKTEMAAAREQKKHPGSQVVAVEGGHAVQPAPVEEANAQAPAATEAAAPQATESAVEEGTDSSSTGTPAAGDAGSAGVEAGSAGAVEAAGLSPKETAIQRRSRMKAGRVAGEPKLNMGLPTPEQIQADQKANPQDWGPSLNESQAESAPVQAGKPETAIERRTRKMAERDGAAPSEAAGSKASTAQGKPETVIERRARLKAERAARADGAGPAVESTTEPQAATTSKQAEPTPAARVIARVGRTPTAATSLELRTNADGTLTPHMEGNALLDFDSGEPIKLAASVSDAEAKQAIRDAGALSSKQHFYAPSDDSAPAFSRSADPLRKLADLAKTATNANETVAVGPVSPEQAALLAAEGVSVNETTKHTADLYAVRHALNRHGDEATEKARGQLPISADDIARVPEVVGEPDAYAVGPKTKRGDDLVGYIKRMPDGAILYIEELRTGKNRLAMLSMRKYPGAKDFASIAQSLLSNARSDTGDVRIVYPQQGDAQAFSRGKPMQLPKVTVEQDNGFPVYFTDKVRLEFPQVTARLDVIEAPGEKVVNYPIMSATGFEVLGHVELLVKGGKAKALLDIEVYPDAGGGRRAGVGRETVEAIVLGTPGDVNISNIVTEARGFWHKLGVPEQNLPDGHAYEGTLNAETLSRRPGDDTEGIRASTSRTQGQGRGADAGAGGGADSGAEGRIDRAPGSARGEREASTERRKAVEALVARVTARWKNAPQVVVVASMADPLVPRAVRQVNAAQLSQGAEGSPEGFFHDGKVYLVAPQLRGDADVVRVLFHEALGHYGLRGTFGPELGTILDRLAVLNAGKVRAKAKQYGLDYDKPSDRRMAAEEVLAEMAQKAPDIGWAKKAVAAIRTWLREHVPGFRKMAMSDDEIVRSFILPARAFVQRGNAAPADGAGQPAFSRSALAGAVERLKQSGGGPKIIGDTGREYTPAQIAAMKNVGFQVEAPTLEQRAKAVWQDAGKKLAQGLVDQFAPIKEIDAEAYSLLRLAKGASGAFEAMLQGGKLKLSDGVYDFDDTQRGGVVDTLLKPLGGEHHDFFRWVAANRAERLLGDGKEHLFTPDDIKALKTLADGAAAFDYELQHGPNAGTKTRDRSLIYADALKTFNGFNKNVLDMAEKSGLIDGESRKLWEHEFYVPFYRVAEEEGGSIGAVNIKGGAVRQQAFKQLKGGKQALNADLMDNTLMNWAHLLDASAKNRAAVATLAAAENMGIAVTAPESTAREMAESVGKKGNVVWVMDGGQKHFYVVDDPYVMTALTSLEYAGMRSPIMKALGSFKHALTLGVTASPFFKIRNLIRDSVQAIGASPLSYNVARNLAQGWKLTDPKSDAYFRLLAGGGTIHFGTMMEGSEAKRVQALVESGVSAGTILNSDQKFKAFYRKFIEPSITAYNELGNRGEAINRASLYAQLRQQGMNHAQASLQARDLMDFSMQGSFTSIRFLAQVVPFFNARLQGLYKLGRAAKEDPARISAVIGAAALASIALLLAYSGDDDWKKREEWDRNGFWWFKFGGVAFRIPKPFEVGAIATVAERGFELMFDKEMTGKRFRANVLALLGDNLSMNPIPQLAKPLLDVYANKDGLSGRPIETMAMEKLKSEYRFNSSTSMTARAISTGLNAVTGTIGKEALSPVQVDALLRGYFGWLGSFAVGAGDMLARPLTNQPDKPSADLFKLATGNMVSDLRDAPSRYVSQMYAQAAEMEKAYSTWKTLVKAGKDQEAAEFLAENKDDISKYKRVERIKRAEGKLSQEIKRVEQGDEDGDVKRERIRALRARQDELARALSAN
jgi:hypothetical protein